MKSEAEAGVPKEGLTIAVPGRKPLVSLFLATACGLGRLRPAPGTWGSLAGVLLFALLRLLGPRQASVQGASALAFPMTSPQTRLWFLALFLPVAVLVAAVGVLVSDRVAKYYAVEDPQFVVIDEVSGQLLTYTLALAPLNWKYLVLGFILFRVFDIWKPFPARQAESLPGGWGIMADDWAAAIYAAAVLWVARGWGL